MSNRVELDESLSARILKKPSDISLEDLSILFERRTKKSVGQKLAEKHLKMTRPGRTRKDETK